MIKEVAGNSCDINVLDVNDEANGVRARSIGVQSLPAVAVGGKLLSCCSSDRITQDDLRSAGIGQLQEPR